MCLPTTYEQVQAGAILHPQNAAERRRLAAAQALANSRCNRHSRRGMHPEFEARCLEQHWGVARPTCVLVCAILKERR